MFALLCNRSSLIHFQEQAKNAAFDTFMRSAGRLLSDRFEDVTNNSSFDDVFPNLVSCDLLETDEKPNADIG